MQPTTRVRGLIQALSKLFAATDSAKPYLGRNGKRVRAGFTKNKGQGVSKARRKMIQASRRRNRGRS